MTIGSWFPASPSGNPSVPSSAVCFRAASSIAHSNRTSTNSASSLYVLLFFRQREEARISALGCFPTGYTCFLAGGVAEVGRCQG